LNLGQPLKCEAAGITDVTSLLATHSALDSLCHRGRSATRD